MSLPATPNQDGPTDSQASQPAPGALAPGRPRGWLRRNWWIVILVAIAAIAFIAQGAIRATHSLQQAKARQQTEPVPGALGPFEWGYSFSDAYGADQSSVKITVQAPVADTDSTAPAGWHSVHCDITVENTSGTGVNVWADDFLLWTSERAALLWRSLGPVHPVEGDSPTHLDAHQSATLTLHYVISDHATTGCVTCGGPDGSSVDGRTWHDAYIQWGRQPPT
jgi:hypothetical protein